MIKPAYSVSFLLSINIFVCQNVLYFPNDPPSFADLIVYFCNNLVTRCEDAGRFWGDILKAQNMPYGAGCTVFSDKGCSAVFLEDTPLCYGTDRQ